MRGIRLLALLVTIARPGPATASSGDAAAVLTPSPPTIDGAIDEDTWQRAPVFRDFVQREPLAGGGPSERTEARFLYDGEALYIGIAAFDRTPANISAPINRPDVTASSDYVWVDLDPFLDRRGGYRFGLTAAGARLDALLSDDDAVDWSWGAVWRGAAQRSEHGWTAEFEVPFSILRFGPQADWGMNLTRHIARRAETSTSSPLSRTSPGWVSRFGRLTGLHVGAFVRSFLWEPYTRAQVASGGERSLSAGLDGLVVLAPGTRIRFTLMPDFGQVEADAAALNLSTFETFFPEKRPFFVEDGALFRTPYTLFFSRRIGRPPPPLALAKGERLVESPNETRILEAMRFHTRTTAGLSLGLLQATTPAETATVVAGDGQHSSRQVGAPAHFTIVRAQQQLGDSALGVLATALHREAGRPVWSGGLDWKLRFGQRSYTFDGQAALTRATEDGSRGTGSAFRMSLSRVAGERLTSGISVRLEDRRFQPNDLGFLQRNDHVTANAWATLQWLRPGPLFREAYLNANLWHETNLARLPLRRGYQLSFDGQLASLGWIGGGVSRGLASYDDRATRGGPAIATSGRWDAWAYYSTDTTRGQWLSLDGGAAGDGIDGSSYRYGVSLGWKPANALELQLGSSFARDVDPAQWLENRDNDGDGTIDSYVFARLTSRVLDLSLRARVAPSPRFTLDFYMQPFLAAGGYDDFKELVLPRSLAFRSFEVGYVPDFTTGSLYSNLVLRWEYRPGSTLIAAWSQSRADDSEPGQLRVGRDLQQLFAADGHHVLAVKWTHHFH